MAGRKFDHALIIITGFLIVFGIIIFASASTSVSQIKFGSTYYYFNHQMIYALIPGIILAFIFSKIDLGLLKKWAPAFLLFNLMLMTFVFLPHIGIKVGRAARWISLGPVSFQPSEILKLTFILYIASWMESRKKKEFKLPKTQKDLKENLAAFIIVLGLIGLLLWFQSDIGTLVVILATGFLMYFFANNPVLHTIILGLIAIVGISLLIHFSPYRLERILIFLNPGTDPMGAGYQIKQSLIAIGSGGIWGLGFGMSQQKLGLLPHPISDSIFAVLAEETGFIGSVVLIFLFLLFLWRGFKIGKQSKNKFTNLTALGITSWILIQALVNIGAMVGVIPLTGIPLPFVSHGGTALIIELIAVGILLNISKTSKV
ncbi:MAG: putative lipid II flippase FtsW [Patescibacteria group bacterium]|nr:putative lipid II flippase FtsW [Patescibacteria group bacterium]